MILTVTKSQDFLPPGTWSRWTNPGDIHAPREARVKERVCTSTEDGSKEGTCGSGDR